MEAKWGGYSTGIRSVPVSLGRLRRNRCRSNLGDTYDKSVAVVYFDRSDFLLVGKYLSWFTVPYRWLSRFAHTNRTVKYKTFFDRTTRHTHTGTAAIVTLYFFPLTAALRRSFSVVRRFRVNDWRQFDFQRISRFFFFCALSFTQRSMQVYIHINAHTYASASYTMINIADDSVLNARGQGLKRRLLWNSA